MRVCFSPVIGFSMMLAAFLPAAFAQAIPSCYDNQSIQFPPKNPNLASALESRANKRAVVVLVDETAVLPAQVQSIAKRINDNLYKPLVASADHAGMFYQVLKFSTFTGKNFASTLVTGTLEPGVRINPNAHSTLRASELATLNALLKKLNTCLLQQAKYGLDKSNNAILTTMINGSLNIPNSDILVAMQQAGTVFKSRKEEEKILIVISDMMEHSAYTSFYSKGGDLKDINPKAELENLQKKGFSADLTGVKVWVLGGGYFPNPGTTQNASARNPQQVALLEEFWTDFFKQSKAVLMEFGKPELIGALPN